MIAFGCSITREDEYRRCAQPGIARVAGPQDRVLARPATGSIFAGYNRILDEAAGLEGLEALVLLHQDAEIADPAFGDKVRAALADPRVGMAGCAGAVGVRSIAWWEGHITWASFVHRYPEFGGGDNASYSWDTAHVPDFCRLGPVDALDGVLLVLSPWVVRNIRFDESLGQALHGYDFDFCLQVRAAGRAVVCADLKVVHHHSVHSVREPELKEWARAHVSVAEKWDGTIPGVGWAPGDWRQRARRAEAQAAATRARAVALGLRSQVQSAVYRQEVSVMTASLGWRLTAPWRRMATRKRQRIAQARA